MAVHGIRGRKISRIKLAPKSTIEALPPICDVYHTAIRVCGNFTCYSLSWVIYHFHSISNLFRIFIIILHVSSNLRDTCFARFHFNAVKRFFLIDICKYFEFLSKKLSMIRVFFSKCKKIDCFKLCR